MPLDDLARHYADTLFVEQCEKLSREHATRSGAARADLAKRGVQPSAGTNIAELSSTGLQLMEALAHARADTLLAACARAGLPIDDQAVEEIFSEVKQLCEVQSRNLAENIRT